MLARNKKVFTLVEVLVVVLIISIVIGVAVITPAVSGPAQRLKDEASRLQVLVEQTRERALLEDREYGLSLTLAGYRWWQWSREEEQWQLLEEKTFRDYVIADDVSLIDTSHGGSRTAKRRDSKKRLSGVGYLFRWADDPYAF